MASPLLLVLHLIFSIFYTLNAQIQISSTPSVILPVKKDPLTSQYITQIHHGLQLKPINLLIDLSAPFISINSDSSLRLVHSCSIQCSIAKLFHKKSCPFENPLASCDLSVHNGITRLTSKGELAEDLIAVRSNLGTQLIQVADFVFAIAPPGLVNGLASGVKGILGLGKSPIGFSSQISAKFESNYNKFATCLSSSNGFLSIGKMGTNTNPILSSLTYTNLVNDPDGYFINVRSIKISSKRVALGGEKRKWVARISTIEPYTTLESKIYGIFKRAYLKAVDFMNMTRVFSAGPFELCFSSKGIESSSFPAIELDLQSDMVTWRMNSMVKLSDGVICLGIVDGGLDLDLDTKTSVVIGGFELEDRLLEFDLGTNMLGYSLPLSMRQGSCSDFVTESVGQEAL